MASKSNGPQKEKIARIHGNQTNRKTKDRGESRTAFKSVLNNPFELKWPVIPLNIQNAILARVIELMQGVSEFQHARQKQKRTAKRQKKAQQNGKIFQENTNALDMDTDQGEAGPSTTSAAAATVTPDVLHAVVVGINEVTKRLEEQCGAPRQILSSSSGDLGKAELGDNESEGDLNRSDRKSGDGDQIQESSASEPTSSAAPLRSLSSSSASASTRAPIRVVLVCRSDIDPPLLVSHIPHLVAACNSVSKDPSKRVKLVTLPKGSENALAHAMGLRRTAVLALDETIFKDASLSTFLSSVDFIVAPWIVCATDIPACNVSKSKTNAPAPLQRSTHVLRRRLEPTHIKQLRTTAPKDMRAAKAQRAKGRTEAKAKRKARQGGKKIPANT